VQRLRYLAELAQLMPGISGYLAARRAECATKREAWAERLNVVLFNHGMIDEILVEETADFLVQQDWLIRRELTDIDVLLIMKAVAFRSTPWPAPLEVALMRDQVAQRDFAARRDSHLTQDEAMVAALARAETTRGRRSRRRSPGGDR